MTLLQPTSPFMSMTFFFLKKFLLQLQCPLFNPTLISLHHRLALVISPSTPTKTINDHLTLVFLFFNHLLSSFLNGSKLIHVDSFKYLGVIISSNLLWSCHIQSICSINLVKTLGSSIVTSISMLLLKFFSLCITLLSFLILPIACLSGTYQYLPPILKFSKKLNTLF